MLSEYLRAAMHHAKYELLSDDGSFFGEIPDFQGVYANQAMLESCREQLEEVLEDGVLFRVSRNLQLPVVDGLKNRN